MFLAGKIGLHCVHVTDVYECMIHIRGTCIFSIEYLYIFNRPEHLGGWASGRQESERRVFVLRYTFNTWPMNLQYEMNCRLKLSQTILMCKVIFKNWFVQRVLAYYGVEGLMCWNSWMQWYLLVKIQRTEYQHSSICKVFTTDGTSLQGPWRNCGKVANAYSLL